MQGKDFKQFAEFSTFADVLDKHGFTELGHAAQGLFALGHNENGAYILKGMTYEVSGLKHTVVDGFSPKVEQIKVKAGIGVGRA